MTVSIKKWGNSLALRIPKDIAQTLHIENNSTLELSIKDGALVIEPVNETLLESLVSGINADNLHTEVDTGKAVGNEEW
ncbi:AbrB/MazE/SpoVT family DNA-binding domain-containing protein [Sulfurovum sp.]|uniref:AbrB/MazE/SpoVT family DNA-binding domain-containing protein n=1 Tax=Sulfurovum sp. TaxID=1969726 RepID=UPI002867C53B|nr:AbrB/MazE/SpoVT family DNA-binding domain-containing protein [Sulfurovum sp.]